MGMPDFPFTPEEQEMLRKAQSLRDSARASRRKRLADEERLEAERERKRLLEAENAKRQRKGEFDDRVRQVLLQLTQGMAKHKLAIISGNTYVNTFNNVSPVILTLEDRNPEQKERLRAEIKWRYGKGFEWD